MPTIKGREFSQEVLKRYDNKDAIPAEIRRMLEENFESALSFLASDNPWLSRSENQRRRVIYSIMSKASSELLRKSSTAFRFKILAGNMSA
jgi:hypothetical protein